MASTTASPVASLRASAAFIRKPLLASAVHSINQGTAAIGKGSSRASACAAFARTWRVRFQLFSASYVGRLAKFPKVFAMIANTAFPAKPTIATIIQRPDDAKRVLLDRLQALADHKAPAPVYCLVPFNLSKDLGDEADEERIVKSATGIRNTIVWKKLFKFQRDGAVGAMDNLERLGVCLLADSVGFATPCFALALGLASSALANAAMSRAWVPWANTPASLPQMMVTPASGASLKEARRDFSFFRVARPRPGLAAADVRSAWPWPTPRERLSPRSSG